MSCLTTIEILVPCHVSPLSLSPDARIRHADADARRPFNGALADIHPPVFHPQAGALSQLCAVQRLSNTKRQCETPCRVIRGRPPFRKSYAQPFSRSQTTGQSISQATLARPQARDCQRNPCREFFSSFNSTPCENFYPKRRNGLTMGPLLYSFSYIH